MKCYICKGPLRLLGSRPFSNKEADLPIIITEEIKHYICSNCNFPRIPSMLTWTAKELAEKVYNSDYPLVDAGYGGLRASEWFKVWTKIINENAKTNIRHLDYGSVEGHLSKMLLNDNWDSNYYDPYSSPNPPTGKFNLITAIEVFEHSTNIFDTVKGIKKLLTKDGCILFTTRLSTGKEKMDWGYLNPRGGHIGILSEKALKIVAKEAGLFFSSITEDLHLLQRFRENSKQILAY